MKKLFILIVFGILFTAGNAYATVGGPTFLYDFKYNPADESVYYTLHSESGRGCPPELKKVSLNTLKHSVVYSCAEGEKLAIDDSNIVRNKINEITSGFKNLIPINLRQIIFPLI